MAVQQRILAIYQEGERREMLSHMRQCRTQTEGTRYPLNCTGYFLKPIERAALAGIPRSLLEKRVFRVSVQTARSPNGVLSVSHLSLAVFFWYVPTHSPY